MGIVILLVVGFSILALSVYKLCESCESHNKPVDNPNRFKINGVNITLTDSEIKEQKKLIEDEFKSRRDELKNKIQKDRDETEDYVRKRVLDGILCRSMFTESDYERTKFMYNDGRLRSNEEVANYDRFQSYTKERANYTKECKKNNAIGFWIPFLIVFIFFCLLFHDIMFLPVSLLFGLIAGFIGLMIGYKTNIRNAKTYGVSSDDPVLKNEKAKFSTGVISGTVAAGLIIHNTKKNAKELMDVNSWEKFS